jgi:hypothetical protein
LVDYPGSIQENDGNADEMRYGGMKHDMTGGAEDTTKMDHDMGGEMKGMGHSKMDMGRKTTTGPTMGTRVKTATTAPRSTG